MTIFKDAIAREMERYQHVKMPEGNYTVGAFVSAVLKIDAPTDSKEFWDGYIAHQTAALPDGDTLAICRSNIGWCFGEGMSDERKQMWIAVSGASHPVFGNMTPTFAEAFQAGVDAVSSKKTSTCVWCEQEIADGEEGNNCPANSGDKHVIEE